MTEPTDAELMDEAAKVGGLFDALALGYQEDDILGFARAVLAKWGTPPAVTVEPYAYAVYFPDQPTEELVHDLDELCDDLTNREHTITKLYAQQPTQAQAAPQSGAKSFQTYAEANAYSRGYYAGKKAAAQAQAGAVPLTDAQSHALIERMANEAEQWAEGLSYEPTQEQLSGLCVAFIQREIHFAHGIKQGGQHGIE